MTDDSRESVLSRWSRRKLAANEEPPEAAEAVTAEDAGDQGTQAVESDELERPLLTDADMPDIESLTDESDFSPFMSPGVSEELRKLALRKMFRGSVFNIRDGLDEYDDDYTSFEKLGDVVTADMKHRIEMEQQKLREKLEADALHDEDGMEVIEDDESEQEPEEQLADLRQDEAAEAEADLLKPNQQETTNEQR